LALKICVPYQQLSVYATELENLQVACELLRKLHRFISLKKRLELQLPSNVALVERDLTAAALTIYELGFYFIK
jgi:hypothetical protein